MFEKILVPVDGSGFAETALPMALTMAGKSGAEVRLAMVNEPVNLPPGAWADAFLKTHSLYLDAITDSVRKRAGDTTISSVLLEGEVASALDGEARAAGADLIVMSSHGAGGLARMWLGSVTDDVMARSYVPVMVVRPHEGDDQEPVGADSCSRVIVPLDGTAFAEAALAPAVDLAALFNVPITLLKAIGQPVLVSSYLPDSVELSAEFVKHAEEQGGEYLERVRSRLVDRAPSIDVAVIVSARPADGVLDFAARGSDHVVVMASHGRRGLARATLGSVADKVVRGAWAPVLIVHPEENEQAR